MRRFRGSVSISLWIAVLKGKHREIDLGAFRFSCRSHSDSRGGSRMRTLSAQKQRHFRISRSSASTSLLVRLCSCFSSALLFPFTSFEYSSSSSSTVNLPLLLLNFSTFKPTPSPVSPSLFFSLKLPQLQELWNPLSTSPRGLTMSSTKTLYVPFSL